MKQANILRQMTHLELVYDQEDWDEAKSFWQKWEAILQ